MLAALPESVERDLGQSEVEHLGMPALGDEDIRRLDVTMHDALGVRRIQRIGDLDGQSQQSLVSSGRPAMRCFSVARPETPSR